MSCAEPTRENLVIGGGLAGAMAALRLAAAGRDVVLVEKERNDLHKVCGEFLSPEAVAYLHQAGVDPLLLGATAIEQLRFAVKKRVIETRLPFRALSLSRCVLDAALLARAAEAGCEIRRGVTATRLSLSRNGWAVTFADGMAAQVRNVFLATGKHDLRGWSRPHGKQGDLVGFKMHWRLPPEETDALRGFMDLFLFEGGYGGLSLVENGIANLCLVVRRSRLSPAGGMASDRDRLDRREQPACAASGRRARRVGTATGHLFHSIWIHCRERRWHLARGRSGCCHPFVYRRWNGNRPAFGHVGSGDVPGREISRCSHLHAARPAEQRHGPSDAAIARDD